MEIEGQTTEIETIATPTATPIAEVEPTKPIKFNKKQTRENVKRDVKLDDQMVQQYVKTLGSSMAPEEKINVIAKNYLVLQRELDKAASTIKENEKQRALLQREKENLLKEYNKGVLFQDRLSTVCREQQQHMKSIRTECLSKLREEEEARKATKEEFQKSIANLFSTIEKQNDENLRMREANKSIAVQFKELSQRSSLGEKQLEKIIEQSNIETTLNDVKMSKEKLERSLEKNVYTKELLTTKEELKNSREIIDQMQIREKMLNKQIALYTDKYSDMQGSMEKSHRVFSTYKTEIDKMSKKMKLLEKDSTEWRVKFERNNLAKMELLTDKQQQDQHIGKLVRQLNQLQKLCRTLQAERTSLIEVLKTNNIERPPLPETLPEMPPIDYAPPPRPQSDQKLDNMTKNCQELKKTLADLQNQMDSYKFGSDKSAAPVKDPESSKKSSPQAAPSNNNKNSNKNKKKKSAQKNETQKEESQNTETTIDDNDSNQKESNDHESVKTENVVAENGISENGTSENVIVENAGPSEDAVTTITENNSIENETVNVDSDVKTVGIVEEDKKEEDTLKMVEINVKTELPEVKDEKITILTDQTKEIPSSSSSALPQTSSTISKTTDEVIETPTKTVVTEQQKE